MVSSSDARHGRHEGGRVLFRPTAHRLDQVVSKLTGGKRSFAGSRPACAVILTTTGAKFGENPAPSHFSASRTRRRVGRGDQLWRC